MMKARVFKYIFRMLQLLLLPFCFIVFGLTVYANNSDGRVLFISSYSYALDAVKIQIEGIMDGLDSGVMLDYEFMDAGRVYDDEAIRLFYEGLKYRMEQVAPYDAVIVGDDVALSFALEYQEELFDGIPIIFEAVADEELAAEAASNPYITGVSEKMSLVLNIQLGLAINPKATKVVAILDDTIIGEAARKRFYSHEGDFPQLTFSEVNATELSTSSLRQAIRNVSKDSILIYMVMTEDASGREYTNREAVELLSEVAQVPVLCMVENGIGEGLLGGNVVSMHQSGWLAAQIAMDVIDGADISHMDKPFDSPNVYLVDMNVMEKYNINSSVLPEDATILNFTGSYFEKYREVLIPGIILLVAMLAGILIVCIDNYRRRKILHQLESARKTIESASQHDFLTGISNRSKFMSDLTFMIEQQVPCSVIMMDIDDFKHINDTMGHKAGDEALQQVAQRMKAIESQILTPYRYAGDEFIFLLRSSQSKLVEKTAYQCRQIFSKPFVLRKSNTKICGSIGIASYPQDTEDMEELIMFADAAMYQVKKNGKNDFAYYHKDDTSGEA